MTGTILDAANHVTSVWALSVDVTKSIFDAAVKVTSPPALSAFVAAVVLIIVYLTRKGPQKVPIFVWIVLIVAIVTPSLGGITRLFVENPLYRLRITVHDPDDDRIRDDATVTTIPFGVPKKVGNAWEVEIAKATLASTRAVTVNAETADGLMIGKEQLTLGDDSNVDVRVKLQVPRDAHISGIVLDPVGRAIANAKVSVVGPGSERVTTDASGSFDLNAHVAKAQSVQLHTEADGFLPNNQTYLAGAKGVTVTLKSAPSLPRPRRR